MTCSLAYSILGPSLPFLLTTAIKEGVSMSKSSKYFDDIKAVKDFSWGLTITDNNPHIEKVDSIPMGSDEKWKSTTPVYSHLHTW